MSIKLVVAAVLSIAVSTSAAARIVGVESRGTITSVSALQNSQTTVTPAGLIAVGDAYTLRATFDPAQAQLTSLFDADPTVNIYYLPGTFVTFSTANYARTFSPVFDSNSSVQIWNNRDVVGPVDSQSFSFFDYNVARQFLPFDLGTGMQSLSLGIQAYDFTATARDSDLISSLVSFDRFNSKSFSMGQLNSDSRLFVSVQGTADTARFITDAVPEPATWAMMILGMGAVGFAMRSAKRKSKVNTTVKFA